MIKVLLNGCLGAMGLVISELVEKVNDIEIVAGIDRKCKEADFNPKYTYAVYESPSDVKEEADVCIDFSSALAIDGILDYCTKKKLPLVLCTTGLSNEQLENVKKSSETIAILRSANMSIGVNLLLKLAAQATKALEDKGFDIEIVEKHHNRKLDAPSGTALALADAVNEAAEDFYDYIFSRSERREKRPENEIGISSVRGGSIVGEHDVIFAGEDEVITLSHSAYSRNIFAKGAVEAAKFLYNKPAGMYSMFDVL